MKIRTNLNPRDYVTSEVVRIINPKQQLLYAKNSIYPIDMYTSIDERTNNAVLVMIFLKEETTEVYQKWCNYELN